MYYDTNGTFITLRSVNAAVSGCGILVISGHLIVDGDFSWYGTIIPNPSLQRAIGILEKGKLNIEYSSTATNYQRDNHALSTLTWKDGSAG